VRSNGQNNFLLNGVDNNVNVIDFLNQTAFVVGPSVEAIGEMRVLTNGYNAEYGRGAGGVVNVSSRAAPTNWHGVASRFCRTPKLNANRWENNKGGQGARTFPQNQFGAAAGGPIIKNRTFIFGDYQGTRIRSSGGVIQNLGYGGFYTIPTPAMSEGQFLQRCWAPLWATIRLVGPAQGHHLRPAIERDRQRAAYPHHVPGQHHPDEPVRSGGGEDHGAVSRPPTSRSRPAGSRNDYATSTAGTQNTDQGDTRVDFRLSDKDSLFGSHELGEPEQGECAAPPGRPRWRAVSTPSPKRTWDRNAQFSYTRVWTLDHHRNARRLQPAGDLARAANPARMSTSPRHRRLQPDDRAQRRLAADAVLQRHHGLTTARSAPIRLAALQGIQQRLGLHPERGVNKGTHALKFGAEYRMIKFPFFQVPYPHGEMYFNSNETAFPSLANGTNGVQEFADRRRHGLVPARQGQQRADLHQQLHLVGQEARLGLLRPGRLEGHPQADREPRPALRAVLAHRREVRPPVELRLRQPDPVHPQGQGPERAAAAGLRHRVPEREGFARPSRQVPDPVGQDDFGPRIGMAYNALDKTVIRLGYGIFYGGEENQGGNPNRGESVPFNQSTRELPRHSMMELAYVGNHQAHQLFQPDWNACPNFGTTNSAISCTTLRPTPYIGGISGTASFGKGNYHGMTARFEKHYSRRPVVPRVVHVRPRPGRYRNHPERFHRLRHPRPAELRERLFQRRLGHSPQLHVQLRL
jgi:hypothetical protein